MILLDTNALIWWLSNRDKLSSKALSAITKSYNKTPILISSMSVWETCLLVKKKRLSLQVPIDLWVKKLATLPGLEFIPIDNQISHQSIYLPGVFHQDPADRIITATAMITNATLITSDKKIRDYKHVKTIW